MKNWAANSLDFGQESKSLCFKSHANPMSLFEDQFNQHRVQ